MNSSPAFPPAPDSGSQTSGNGNGHRDPFPTDRLRSVRSRFRENSHEEAHDDDAPSRGKLPEHPLIPRNKARLVSDDDELRKLVAELRAPLPELEAQWPQGSASCFAYDSEFIGESTYFPLLCLIQVATPKRVVLIDPLADLDLNPFWELLGDPAVRKIVHAGEQDLEPAVRLAGVSPVNITDTQIVAGFCALPYPTSLAKLVEHFTGVRLGKGLTFTQWDQRPLSKKQLAYAADDVRFLPAVAAALDECLRETGFAAWAQAECDARSSATALANTSEPYERVKGGGGLTGQQRAVLRELAAWRDEAAREADLPPRALLRDEVLVGLARRPVKDVAKLAQVRHMPRPVADRYGAKVLAALARGAEADPLETNLRKAEPTLPERFTGDAAWALLQTIAIGRAIDPNLLASRREAEGFAQRVLEGKPVDRHPLMTGWRREAAGDLLVRLLRGQAQARLKWHNNRPSLSEATETR